MSRNFEIETNSEVVKIELISDDEDGPNIDDIPDDLLLKDWDSFPTNEEVPPIISNYVFGSENNSHEVAINGAKEEPEDAMDWNSQPIEKGNHGILDILPPRICVESELGKDERDRIIRDGVNFVHEFQSWRPSLVIEPKPGNIYFVKGQISERERLHGADGLSWASSGRSLANPRKAVISYYYVASPDVRKMTYNQKKIYCADPERPKTKVFTKKITYRKIVSFHEKAFFYMIEYFGDDKALPWVPRKNWAHLKKQPSNAQRKYCSTKPDPKLQIQPVVIMEKVTVSREKIKPRRATRVSPEVITPVKARSTPEVITPVKSSSTPEVITPVKVRLPPEVNIPTLEPDPKISKAVVFKTVEPHAKVSDQKEINDMLSRNPFGPLVNDALSTKIINPRAGEIYLMNLTNLDSWSGIYHCDSHTWRLRNIQSWKDYGHITFHFTFLRHGKASDFKKAIHFNSLTKMKLIQYHGNDAGVPRSEKVYRLPSFQECVEQQPRYRS